MIIINKLKAVLVILIITLITWLFVFLLFIAGKLTLPIMLSCTCVSFLVVLILSIALYSNYRFNKMATISTSAQVIQKSVVDDLECLGEIYVYNTQPILKFRYTMNQSECVAAFNISDELFNSVSEGQDGVLTLKRRKNQLFFVSFIPDQDNARATDN